MNLQAEELDSFVGGTNDSASATAYLPGEAAVMQNVRISEDGTAEVRYGSVKTRAAALNSGAQFFGLTKTPFITAAGVEMWVGFCGDKAYTSTDNGVTWTQIATGLRQDYWSLSRMQTAGTNYLLCVNGGTVGYKYDGTTWATITNLPSGVKVGAVFNDRYCVAGHNGVYVQGSAVGDFEVWSGSGTWNVPVQTHDGDDRIRALFQIGSILLVGKRRSTAYVSGSGRTSLVVQAGAVGLSRSVGVLGFRTMQPFGDQGCMWLSDRGIEYYEPGGKVRCISKHVRRFFSSIAMADIEANAGLADAVFASGVNEYLLAVSSAGLQNDYLVRVHGNHPRRDGGFAITFDTYGTPDGGTLYVDENGSLSFSSDATGRKVRTEAGSLTLVSGTEAGRYVEISAGSLSILTTGHDHACLAVADRDGEISRPLAGGYDGFVRQLEKGSADNMEVGETGGTDIAGVVRDQPRHFRARFNEKWGREVQALIESPTAGTVTFALRSDGVERSSKDVTVSATADRDAQQYHARLTARGPSIQAELRSTVPGMKFTSMATLAEVRQRRV